MGLVAPVGLAAAELGNCAMGALDALALPACKVGLTSEQKRGIAYITDGRLCGGGNSGRRLLGSRHNQMGGSNERYERVGRC